MNAKYASLIGVLSKLNIASNSENYRNFMFGLQAEIDGRQESFKILKEAGLKLNPVKEEELSHLEELRRTLNSAWDERKTKLNQALQWQLFKEQAEQAESWLVSKEAFLNNDDLGVRVRKCDR